MVIMEQTIEEIERKAIMEISKQVNKFGTKIRNGTTDTDEFISMDEIENDWKQLKNATEETYTNMVSKMISAIDERGIVRKKKWSTDPEE